MITKYELLEMIECSNSIAEYNFYKQEPEECEISDKETIEMMEKCISEQNKIIQTILAKLDVTIEPTETTVT